MLSRRQCLHTLFAAGVSLVGVPLGACSGRTSGTALATSPSTISASTAGTPSASAAVSVSSASIAASTASVAVPPRQAVQLVLLHAWNQERLPLMNQMRDQFQQRNPGITVSFDITTTAAGMTSPRVTKLVTAVAGGAPPDVSMIWRGELPALAVGGTLQPIEQFTQRDKFDSSIYYDAEWQTSRYQTKTFGLPNVSAGAWHALYYNRSELKEAGFAPDEAGTTWTDYTDHLKRLTKSDATGMTRLGADVEGGADAFTLALLNNKGQYLSDDGKKVLFDSAAGAEALQWWSTFYDPVGGRTKVNAFLARYKGVQDAQAPFVTGAQAMKFQNPSQIFHIKAGNPNLDFGVTAPPYGPRDSAGKSFINGGWGYGMPTGVKHAAESWLLIHWLCATTEAAGWFMIQQLRPSPMKAVNQDKAYLDKLPTVWPQLLQVLAKDVAVPITPVDSEIAKILNQTMADMLTNKGSATDLVHQAATRAQQQLDMFWAKHST